jgi:hypothetical protein
MTSLSVWIVILLILSGCVAALQSWRSSSGSDTADGLDQARRLFVQNQKLLQDLFLELARSRGKPQGLHWARCDWKPEVTFAQEIESGLLTAFQQIEIQFEAIPGGEMEDVEAVDQAKFASAVFHYGAQGWGTGGRALFNLSPDDCVERLAGQYLPVSFSEESELA